MYINHMTLLTGENRRSPRSEVDDQTINRLYPWLHGVIRSGKIEPLPVEGLRHYRAKAFVEVGLVVTVYGLNGACEMCGFSPIVTLAVAQRSRQARYLWEMFAERFEVKEGTKMPATPWCAVALHPNIIEFKDALSWLGDFERSVAWAWITRHPDIRSAHDL